MTQKQLIMRLVKEVGLVSALKRFTMVKKKMLFGEDYVNNTVFDQIRFLMCYSLEYGKEGIFTEFSKYSVSNIVFDELKKTENPSFTVMTSDGKHEIRYKLEHIDDDYRFVYYGKSSTECVDFRRIVKVNNKPVDVSTGWYLIDREFLYEEIKNRLKELY